MLTVTQTATRTPTIGNVLGVESAESPVGPEADKPCVWLGTETQIRFPFKVISV